MAQPGHTPNSVHPKYKAFTDSNAKKNIEFLINVSFINLVWVEKLGIKVSKSFISNWGYD